VEVVVVLHLPENYGGAGGKGVVILSMPDLQVIQVQQLEVQQ
jgi:hypothetical protein